MSLAELPLAVRSERKVPGESPMLRSFKAYNFRCFKSVELSDLRRVNIVVGKNAAGKTALLEAIRLGLSGTPVVLWSMNAARGFQTYFPQPPTREQFEAQWNAYFFNLDTSEPILTECVDSKGRKATLKVYYDPKKTVTPIATQPSVAVIATIVPLAFERTDFAGKTTKLYGSLHPGGQLNLEAGQELGMASEFYSSSLQTNPQQTAQWFSQLSVQKREREVIDAVTKEYGALITDLTVLSPSQIPAIYADLPHLHEKLPLSLISAGINKFVTVLAAILTRTNGVVLIDEIENGFYYETFPALWRAIWTLANQYETQVFASTHSLECMRALLPTLREHEQDFALLRAERQNGSSGITPIQGTFFEAALEQNFEVR